MLQALVRILYEPEFMVRSLHLFLHFMLRFLHFKQHLAELLGANKEQARSCTSLAAACQHISYTLERPCCRPLLYIEVQAQ